MFNLRILSRPASRLIQTPIIARNIRPISYTSTRLARKDAQGKDELKPEPNEYSKSGSDDEAARTSKTAFDPNTTSPEQQHDDAGAESDVSSPHSNFHLGNFFFPGFGLKTFSSCVLVKEYNSLTFIRM